MQANVVHPSFVFPSDNFAVYDDIHVVFPFMMSASLTQIHSTHGRFLENVGLLFHARIHYEYTELAQDGIPHQRKARMKGILKAEQPNNHTHG